MPTLSAVIGSAAPRISQQSYYHNTLQNSESGESILCNTFAIVIQKKVFYYCLLYCLLFYLAWIYIMKMSEK